LSEPLLNEDYYYYYQRGVYWGIYLHQLKGWGLDARDFLPKTRKSGVSTLNRHQGHSQNGQDNVGDCVKGNHPTGKTVIPWRDNSSVPYAHLLST